MNGRSIETEANPATPDAGGSTSGGFAYSTIENCQLINIDMASVGDDVALFRNIIGFNDGGSAPGVRFDQIEGAASFSILYNVISNQNGMIQADAGTSVQIVGNEFEQGSSNSRSFLVGVGVTSGMFVTGATITGNSISAKLRVRVLLAHSRCQRGRVFVHDNRIGISSGTTAHVRVESAAVNANIGVNEYMVGNTEVQGTISNLSSSTNSQNQSLVGEVFFQNPSAGLKLPCGHNSHVSRRLPSRSTLDVWRQSGVHECDGMDALPRGWRVRLMGAVESHKSSVGIPGELDVRSESSRSQ